MTIQWINDPPSPCSSPGGSPMAATGGVMGVPDDGVLGQPYLNENWVYTFWGSNGALLSNTSLIIRTHSQGLDFLKTLAQSALGKPVFAGGPSISRVCGTYAPTGYVKAPQTTCTTDGVNVFVSSLPPTLQTCLSNALQFWGVANQQYAVAQCLGSYIAAQYSPIPTPPGYLPPVPPSIPVVPFRPGGTTIVAEIPPTIVRPPFTRTTTFTPGPFANLQPLPTSFRFTSGPRWLGQTCDEAKQAIAELENARAQLMQALTQASAGYNAAAKAWNQLPEGPEKNAAADAVNTAQAQVYDIKSNIANVDGELVKAKAALTACEAGSAAPPPQQGCQNDHPDCGAAGFICVNGECVPGCRNDGDCGTNFRCINGQCAPPPVKKAGMGGGGWALFLLGLAAVAGIFLGRPGMDAEEG